MTDRASKVAMARARVEAIVPASVRARYEHLGQEIPEAALLAYLRLAGMDPDCPCRWCRENATRGVETNLQAQASQ